MEQSWDAIRTALISVSNTRGLIPFAQGLRALGIEIVATDRTARILRRAQIDVRDVAAVTGWPAIMGGRVKTLHPKIAGGVLADHRVSSHLADVVNHQIPPIGLVIVNFYPFASVVKKIGCTLEQADEAIDVGGLTLVQAAIKNRHRVTVVTSPRDYRFVLEHLQQHNGATDLVLRHRLAIIAMKYILGYEQSILSWLEGQGSDLTQTRAANLRAAGLEP